jgi:hypothetical protein
MDSPLLNLQAVIVDKKGESAVAHGQSISLDVKHQHSDEYCRTYSLDGEFIAVLRFIRETGLWHPKRVFIGPDAIDSGDPKGLTANI